MTLSGNFALNFLFVVYTMPLLLRDEVSLDLLLSFCPLMDPLGCPSSKSPHYFTYPSSLISKCTTGGMRIPFHLQVQRSNSISTESHFTRHCDLVGCGLVLALVKFGHTPTLAYI